MATRLPAILLVAAAAILGCAHPKGITRWHEVTGASFSLRSCGDPDETLALAADLAETRATLQSLLPEIPDTDRVPFHLSIFCRSDEYGELAPHPHQANHFVAALRGADLRVEHSYEGLRVATATTERGTRMAARGAQLRPASDLIRHHYIHHLIRAHVDVPLWIEEGLAAFVGTAIRVPGGVQRGHAQSGMFDLVELETQIPFDRVLRATDLRTWPRRDKVFFYRSSWLITHFLHFGSIAKEEPASPRLLRFAETYAKRGDEHEAAEAAFGRSTIRLRSDVDRYLSVHKLLLKRGRVQPPMDASGGAGLAIQTVKEQDLAYGLGVFALENGDAETAEAHFNTAVLTDPESAAAHAGRARALALQGRWDPAMASLEHAEQLAASDARVLLDGAWLLTARANSAAAVTDDLRNARSRAAQAAELYPELAEAHYRLAQTYELASERTARIDALERAHAAAPGAIDVALALAAGRAEVGRIEEARELGSRVAGWVLGERRDRDVYAFLDALPEPSNVAARD